MHVKHKTIITLEVNASGLISKGWCFITFFQAKRDSGNSLAHKKAIEKASILEHQTGIQTGIQTIVNNAVSHFEVWSRK